MKIQSKGHKELVKNKTDEINFHTNDKAEILEPLSTSSLKENLINNEQFNFTKLIECHKLTLINTVNNIGDCFFDAVLNAYFNKQAPTSLLNEKELNDSCIPSVI